MFRTTERPLEFEAEEAFDAYSGVDIEERDHLVWPVLVVEQVVLVALVGCVVVWLRARQRH